MQNTVLILDFGSRYTQLIARRVRELNIYCEIHPYNKIPKNRELFKAIILSDSPASIGSEKAPNIDFEKINLGKPILGIGYGAQLIAKNLGGKVSAKGAESFTPEKISNIKSDSILFKSIPENSKMWLCESAIIEELPEKGNVLAGSETQKIAAFEIENKSIFGGNFLPEVHHSEKGKQLIENFLIDIAKVSPDWTPAAFVENTVKQLQKQIGNDKVVLGLSGGVDSTVAATLLNKAIGKNLYCIFVNHGLLRKNEFSDVLEQYKGMGLNVKGVDASERFYDALKNESDPEKKRKAIGRVFIEVFDDEAHQVRDVNWLAQGTIYPDVIESVSVDGSTVAVKSHHNVGGLPDFMKLKIVEPLRMLFKDEVRLVGKELGIHPDLIGRHPFPGPGLAIRILGDITPEKVRILQEVDHIFISSLKKWNLYDEVWQAGAILLPINSVGVSNDKRTYEQVVALRAVNSVDGMTADIIQLPYEFLQEVSNRIINEVNGVNRVVYDISSKPPATIEWE